MVLLKYSVSSSRLFNAIIVELFCVYCRLRKGLNILFLRTKEKRDTKRVRGVDSVLVSTFDLEL